VFTTREIVAIPYAETKRSASHVQWKTDALEPLLLTARTTHAAIVKVHSHPQEVPAFSMRDDASDNAVFGGISNFIDDGLPHASVIMLPDGTLIGRVLQANGDHVPLHRIMIVGDDIAFHSTHAATNPAFMQRTTQAFGQGTTARLRALAIAVVGCSGTGSIVIEQLTRLGVGKLVLIDPDRIEDRNLNRIINARKNHVVTQEYKVQALAAAIADMGLGTEVEPLPLTLGCGPAVEAAANCDVVIGCMDGVEGRHLLNRIATFYCLPYLDVGVKLEADGNGGIAMIAGSVHYLQPGRSSLLSRGVYTLDDVAAAELHRTDPALYARQKEEGYLRGVAEDRPAVISINMFFASLAVNELLARLHPYRNQPNEQYSTVRANLTELLFDGEPESAPCTLLQPWVGRGDLVPILNRPGLT
jgi:hypothetical protein